MQSRKLVHTDATFMSDSNESAPTLFRAISITEIAMNWSLSRCCSQNMSCILSFWSMRVSCRAPHHSVTDSQMLNNAHKLSLPQRNNTKRERMIIIIIITKQNQTKQKSSESFTTTHKEKTPNTKALQNTILSTNNHQHDLSFLSLSFSLSSFLLFSFCFFLSLYFCFYFSFSKQKKRSNNNNTDKDLVSKNCHFH